MEAESRRRQRPFIQRVVIHIALLCGAALFAFPFFWMIATSFKTRREAGDDKQRLFPSAPHPQLVTPYIDSTEFDPIDGFDGVPPDVWTAAKPKLDKLIDARVAAWAAAAPPMQVDPAALQTEMREGIYAALDKRLSDFARGWAVHAVREANRAAGIGGTESDYELSRHVGDGFAVPAAGVILAESATIVNDALLSETFDAIYRRFCVGNVRVQLKDYSTRMLYTGSEWSTHSKRVTLVHAGKNEPCSQEVRFGESAPNEINLLFSGDNLDFDPTQIHRIFISYRGDESWARVSFDAILKGFYYEADASRNLHERDWIEQELCFQSGDSNPYARRNYVVLQPSVTEDVATFPIEIRMHITRASLLSAWLSKLTLNYRQTFREVPYTRYVLTSFSLAILNILLSVFSCTLVAYGFARLSWPGRDFWFVVLLATMMLPPQVTMIPSFLVIKSLGWYNTLLPLWVPAAFGAPFFIFLARQFFKNVPVDLEDAARVDGCSFLGIYWRVVLPLARPVVAAIAIFTFIGTWNNFMGPLIYVNDERLFPLAMGLFKFNLVAENNVSLIMAASFLMTLPIVVLFFAMQRYFVQGITLTGVKG